MPLSVVILAAGQGKRMGSDLPKVLQPLAGRPLLAHVVATARALQPDAIYVVHGHGAKQVRAAIPGGDIRWSLQSEQKGTGHAVAQAMPGVPDGHTALVRRGIDHRSVTSNGTLFYNCTGATLIELAPPDADG